MRHFCLKLYKFQTRCTRVRRDRKLPVQKVQGMVSIQNEIGTRCKFAYFEAIKGQDRVACQYARGFSLLPGVLKHLKNEIHAWKTRLAWICVINFCRWWWHHEWPFFGAFQDRIGPSRSHVHRSESMPVCAVLSEWAAFPQIVVRWFWDSAKISVFENHSPLNAEFILGNFSFKSGIPFFGRLCPKMPRKIVFFGTQLPRGAHYLNFGGWKCVCVLGGVKSHGIVTSIFGAREWSRCVLQNASEHLILWFISRPTPWWGQVNFCMQSDCFDVGSESKKY